MTASFPSDSSASFAASTDPSASPSGFSWGVSRQRSCSRRARATASRSVVVWGELIDELSHPHSPLNRRIVLKAQLGSSFHSQLASQTCLEDAVRGREPLQRPLALLLGAEHADEDASFA